MRAFDFPSDKFSHIIHAATEASATLNAQDPTLMFDTIVQGTRRTLDFAKQCGAKKFLLTSSGAVYGKQPPEISHIPEDYAGAPDPSNPSSAYGEGKRAAELLSALYSREYGFEAKIARCFAFVGPYLPLDQHFAIGNFIRDGLNGGPIQVKGDGTPFRSYLYAADLAIWLWTILIKGKSCRPYNVGSGECFTIAEIAHQVAEAFSDEMKVVIEGKMSRGTAVERYVPDTSRATRELYLRETVPLNEAVMKTISFHKNNPGPA